MPLNRRNVLPPGRSPCRVTSQIRSRCPDLRPDKLNHPRGCRHHIIWHETEQPQRPDLQTANQTSARADTIPHQLKITFAQRETADQILGGYLHRETVQHRTIVITQEAAASHINHPETEPSSHHPQPHQHHSPRHPGHPTSNSTVTSRPFTGRTPIYPRGAAQEACLIVLPLGVHRQRSQPESSTGRLRWRDADGR